MKNILKIQQLESEIRKLKQSANNSRENVMYEQLKESRKTVRDNINTIENNAGVIIKQLDQIRLRYEQLNAKSEITAKQKPDKAGLATISTLVEGSNYLASELAKLEQKMRELNDKASRLVNEFNNAMNELRNLKAKQDKMKAIVEDKQANILPAISEKQAQIKKLEGNVDNALYEKYKALKNDNIFPVFVHLRGNRCGGCQMEQSLNFVQKLKQKGMLPCEECRCIILSDD